MILFLVLPLFIIVRSAKKLTRHLVDYSDDSMYKFNFEKVVIEDLLKKAAENVTKDECWKNETRSYLVNFCYSVDDELLHEINQISFNFGETNDPEKFFQEFYSNITAKATHFFKDLPLASANILMIQLGEMVFGYIKNSNASAININAKIPSPITEIEIDALQYLSGYVVHKCLKKVKNNPTYNSVENQAIILVLDGMVDKTRDQRLVDSLNRGGLTPISEDCEQIFYKAEELFRQETSVFNLRNINIPEITSNLMCQSDMVSLINSIVNISGSDIDSELKDNLFEKMIQLYLRVRSFSLAKDLTSGKKKSCSNKAKGLRKEIKRSLQKPLGD